MKNYLFVLLISSNLFSHEANAWDHYKALIPLAVATAVVAVGGAAMIGVSTYPNGEFNQEFSCRPADFSSCCTPALVSSEVVATNCTLQSTPTPNCKSPAFPYCPHHTSGMVPAPYILQTWAKNTQIAGAALLSVFGAGCIVATFLAYLDITTNPIGVPQNPRCFGLC